MLRFTYLVSVDFFFFFSLYNEYFRKRGFSSSSTFWDSSLTPVLKVWGSSLPFLFKSLNLQMGASPDPSEDSLLAAVNQGRLCCSFRNVMGTKSLGLGRGGGALHFQSRWSFRDKVIMLIIPRFFFFFFLPLNWTLCLSQLWLPFWTVSLGGLGACLGWVNSWMKIFSLAVFKMLPPFKSWTLWQQSAFCPDYHCHFGRSFPAEQTMEF